MAASPRLFAQPASTEVQITDKARSHFTAGVNYMQDPDGARYEEAYREFRAAYSESPSWKILGNLGIAAMKLERDGEAIEAFEKYLAEAGEQLDPAERAQVERDLQTLRASVVRLTVESVPAGAALVDERSSAQGSRIVNHYGPLETQTTIGIRPGQHRFTARLAGHQDVSWDFDARPGATESHSFQLQPVAAAAASSTPLVGGDGSATATHRPVPKGVYIGLAATGLFAVGASVTGLVALGQHGEYDDALEQGDRETAEDAKSYGESLNLVADVLWGGTLVSGAITAVLYFSRPEVPVGGDSAGLHITPVVGRRTTGLSVSGSF